MKPLICASIKLSNIENANGNREYVRDNKPTEEQIYVPAEGYL